MRLWRLRLIQLVIHDAISKQTDHSSIIFYGESPSLSPRAAVLLFFFVIFSYIFIPSLLSFFFFLNLLPLHWLKWRQAVAKGRWAVANLRWRRDGELEQRLSNCDTASLSRGNVVMAWRCDGAMVWQCDGDSKEDNLIYLKRIRNDR